MIPFGSIGPWPDDIPEDDEMSFTKLPASDEPKNWPDDPRDKDVVSPRTTIDVGRLKGSGIRSMEMSSFVDELVKEFQNHQGVSMSFVGEHSPRDVPARGTDPPPEPDPDNISLINDCPPNVFERMWGRLKLWDYNIKNRGDYPLGRMIWNTFFPPKSPDHQKRGDWDHWDKIKDYKTFQHPRNEV